MQSTYKLLAKLLLSIAVLVDNQFDYCNGIDSTDLDTTNAFPSTFLTDIVKSDVVKQKLLSRWKWQVWDVMPGSYLHQFYVFNVTNPDKVEMGEKPILHQLGPYTYRENRYKFDVSINLDLEVNYAENFSYSFIDHESKGDASDIVTTVNIPFVVFSTIAAKYSPSPTEANQAVDDLVNSGEAFFKPVKVEDILFNGINVSKYQKYLNLLGPETPIKQQFRNGLLRVLKMENGPHLGQYTVNSGLKVESQVGNIVLYNDKPTLSYWDGTCNNIEGTDGSIFPPKTKASDSLHMLETNLCRSVSFDYKKTVHLKSLEGHLYSISEDILADSSTNKENSCFCNKETKDEHGRVCLKNGVLDVSSCHYDAPYVMSHPHFLNANAEYQQAVSGLNPDPNLHSTQVTIEPITGVVITFQKRYQTNIWIKPLTGIDFFQKVSHLIIPILWNDNTYSLNPEKEELLEQEVARQAGGG